MQRIAAVIVLSLIASLSGCNWFDIDSGKPNIVVIMMDTLRADHIGAYGYERETTPNIDAIAARGTLFTTVYSVSNWTNPAIKSIFTGRYPQSVMREALHEEAIRMPLPETVETFAELLQAEGYRTAGLVDHPGISPKGNWAQGFEQYTMLYRLGAEGRGSWGKSNIKYVAEQFEQTLDTFGDDPFLVYLHVVYPHRPYRAPAPWKGLFGDDEYGSYKEEEANRLINAYDAEIRRMDDLVGKVEQALETQELLGNTWIILLSDHGEGFWEHGYYEHGNVFFDEIIRVPLIIAPPTGSGPKGQRVETPVSNVDVFSSILDIAGIEPHEETVGFSLVREDSPAFGENARMLFSTSPHTLDIHAATLIQGGFKYTHYPNVDIGKHQLFDLHADPGERNNLYRQMPDRVNELAREIDAHKEAWEIDREWLAQELQNPDEETLEGLKSLGYTQ